MDQRLEKALEFSNYRQTLALQRKNLKERISGKLTYGHAGGIFKIDQSLLVFIQMLIDRGRTKDIPILDLNENPVLIPDLEKFKDEIFDRYFSATYEYYIEYEKIKKSRTVEKLLES
jgi:hypothetical protein